MLLAIELVSNYLNQELMNSHVTVDLATLCYMYTSLHRAYRSLCLSNSVSRCVCFCLASLTTLANSQFGEVGNGAGVQPLREKWEDCHMAVCVLLVCVPPFGLRVDQTSPFGFKCPLTMLLLPKGS